MLINYKKEILIYTSLKNLAHNLSKRKPSIHLKFLFLFQQI